MMFYRVTKTYHDGTSDSENFEDKDFSRAFQDAKTYVDKVYKNYADRVRRGPVDPVHCRIHKVTLDELVPYQSPWNDPRFQGLLDMDHEALVVKCLGLAAPLPPEHKECN
jgi:hypothetical protein